VSPEERRERIRRYAEGPTRLRAAYEAAPPESRAWRPEPGEFSVHEIVCHCAESEMNAAARIRYLLTAEQPLVLGYDPDVWAERFDYAGHPAEAALAMVEAARANTVPVLERLTEEDWARAGTHTESGHYSATDWLRIYSEHVEEHIGQLERTLEAWRASASGQAN
jgi:hypothetical protein